MNFPRLATFCLAACFAQPVYAQSTNPSQARLEHYRSYVKKLKRDLIKERIAPKELVRQAMEAAKNPNPAILKRDKNQPEFKWSWQLYASKILTPKRFAMGKQAYLTYGPALNAATARYGADQEPVLGIWGIESRFGRTRGQYNVFQSLVSLAYDGRREKFFKSQIESALKLADRNKIPPASLTGSYAGAMGQPQFMPEAYLRFAVSATDGKTADIWNSVPDSLASIANYLKHSGWVSGESWGQSVRIAPAQRSKLASQALKRFDMTDAKPVSYWIKSGVKPADKTRFPSGDTLAILVQPDGEKGESFLLYRNFKAIMRYNPSLYYGLAVGTLGRKALIWNVKNPAGRKDLKDLRA